jgi:predicted signal transduction protein with EAL and GGDEF domain
MKVSANVTAASLSGSRSKPAIRPALLTGAHAPARLEINRQRTVFFHRSEMAKQGVDIVTKLSRNAVFDGMDLGKNRIVRLRLHNSSGVQITGS